MYSSFVVWYTIYIKNILITTLVLYYLSLYLDTYYDLPSLTYSCPTYVNCPLVWKTKSMIYNRIIFIYIDVAHAHAHTHCTSPCRGTKLLSHRRIEPILRGIHTGRLFRLLFEVISLTDWLTDWHYRMDVRDRPTDDWPTDRSRSCRTDWFVGSMGHSMCTLQTRKWSEEAQC